MAVLGLKLISLFMFIESGPRKSSPPSVLHVSFWCSLWR